MMLSLRRALVWSLADCYASYSPCAAFGAVAGIARDFGVSEYLIEERELTRERLRSAFGIALGSAGHCIGVVLQQPGDTGAVLVSTPAVGCALWFEPERWLRHPVYAGAGAA